MLAGARSYFLLLSLFSTCAVLSVPCHAQALGVPPSINSMGFGGRVFNPGVPPSVTSLGPNGLRSSWLGTGNCCANFFFPAASIHSGQLQHRHSHKDRDRVGEIGFSGLDYIPYGVPYAVEDGNGNENESYSESYIEDDDSGDVELDYRGSADSALSTNRTPDRNLSSSQPAGFRGSPIPVVAQLSTLLVYKDGHHFELRNYAIVGDTLFDFSPGHPRKIQLADIDLPATQKVNDDRGVDFIVPPGAVQ